MGAIEMARIEMGAIEMARIEMGAMAITRWCNRTVATAAVRVVAKGPR